MSERIEWREQGTRDFRAEWQGLEAKVEELWEGHWWASVWVSGTPENEYLLSSHVHGFASQAHAVGVAEAVMRAYVAGAESGNENLTTNEK